ncbi:MAG TPA: class I SAM-dependent methyltransferase [Streptosporangiaceae bacterium]|jgi:SAM-dependent methyltransferase|nr:class I SAM-dependent methyltransferase [Streptosporangiaceae bacterium]
MNEDKLMGLVHQAVGDFGSILTGALVVLGDRLDLYRHLADAGRPLTSAELATAAGCAERYVREWLNGQAASGYVTYADGRYALDEEQAIAFTDESSPACVIGGFQAMLAATRAIDRLTVAFRTGEGLGWHEHHDDLFRGTERFFRPGYNANLTTSWIPALEGVEDKLRRGAKVADVGCGHGASTVIMARAFPESTFTGFDYHAPSIDAARKAAAEAGVDDRVTFDVAPATEYPGTGYDLVGFFDCLHDMGDPTGAARHVLASLASDGTWLIVEPFANDDIAGNLNPVGRLFYSVSTLVCTPASLSQEVGTALGAQAGETRLRDVVTTAGFTRFRRAAETPFNLVLEARP